jgi:hypothetical protein
MEPPEHASVAAQRHVLLTRGFELASEVRGIATGTDQLDHLPAELNGVCRTGLGHRENTSRESTLGVHQIGAVPEGGHQAVHADEKVVGTSRVREVERRVRDLERLLGRKTMEVEILKEALDLARTKNRFRRSALGAVRRAVCGKGGRRHARRGPPPPGRAPESARSATRPLPKA